MSVNLIPSFRRGMPSRREVLQVFGIVLFAVFGWSIRGFLYKIPSFTLYFGLTANLAIVCYMLVFALLESVLVMAVLLALSILLPGNILKQGFAYKGFIIVVVAAAAAIVFESWYRVGFFKDLMAGMSYMVPPLLIGFAAAIVLLAVLFWLFRTWPQLQRYAQIIMEQLSIFTYIYVPLGLLGLLVVLIRNLP